MSPFGIDWVGAENRQLTSAQAVVRGEHHHIVVHSSTRPGSLSWGLPLGAASGLSNQVIAAMNSGDRPDLIFILQMTPTIMEDYRRIKRNHFLLSPQSNNRNTHN
jgi:hypothetical protein